MSGSPVPGKPGRTTLEQVLRTPVPVLGFSVYRDEFVHVAVRIGRRIRPRAAGRVGTGEADPPHGAAYVPDRGHGIVRILLIATELFQDDQGQARVLQGLVTGMGFIGGSAILKRDGRVEGTATAASPWATGAVGAALAYSRLDIAIAISLIVFLTLRLLTPVEEKLIDKADIGGGGDVERSKQP